MSYIIYENLEAAKLACKEYVKEILELEDKIGVWNAGSDESVVATIYRDANGDEKRFSTSIIDINLI